jgi:ATP-binding cassette subfamily F protein 3
MIQIQNLCLSFGDQKIFNNLNYLINGNEKIGLVGLNGSGKSTLLKIIAGQQQPDDGRVLRSSGVKIGYMPQEVVLISTLSVVEEVVTAVEVDITEIEAIRAEAKKMLMGLGFTTEQMAQPVVDLSVGWRMRVVLAQLLLQKADFYLFDEPTNHLDIITKEWFLNFLKKAPFGFLLVCHEQYFLDHVCTSILELEHATGTPYKGNYSAYIHQKAERRAALEAAYVQQQKEIERKKDTINRFKASATKASAAQSMQKALDKIEVIKLPPDMKSVEFKLPPITPSGQIVLTVDNIQHAFDSKKIFNNISFTVERNEKIALIAANGVGKTTLLSVIMGKYPLQGGKITFGHNVSSAFFEQDQVTALDPSKTIFEIMQAAAPSGVTDQDIRSMLGCFLFSKDFVYKKAKVLSGGERNRLSMARVLLQKSNFLVLDEPTNHLDIQSKNILLDALKQYKGTILFVSHDQGFINDLATHIIELTPTAAHKYSGNYEDFLDHKQFVEQHNVSTDSNSSTTSNETKVSKADFDKGKDIRKLEAQIEKLETEINRLSEELGDYDYGTDEFSSRYDKIEEFQKKLKPLSVQWEQLSK